MTTIKYINIVSANYVTECAQHFSLLPKIDLQLLKMPLCKNLGVKKLMDFAGKRPWLHQGFKQGVNNSLL